MGNEKKEVDVMQRLSPNENLGLGLLSGMMTKMCNYPLLNWKNTAQQGLPISFKPNIVYRGCPMACMNLGATTSVQFGFVGLFQGLLNDGSGMPLPREKVLAAAFMGGVCSGIPCSMLELTII